MGTGDVGYVKLVALVKNNPAYALMLLAVLDYCKERRSEEDACAHVDSLRTSASQIQTAASLVGMLVKHGGLERTIIVDGKPFEGTVQELQERDDIPEDAVVETFVATTSQGVRICQDGLSHFSVKSLFEEKPHRRAGFLLVLEACADAPGKTTKELEKLLREADCLDIDERTGLPRVYASFFTGELERVGALDWDGKRWITSAKGREAFAQP